MTEIADSQLVQVRMKNHTLEQIDRFKAIVRCSGRSEALRRAVGITELLVNAVSKGERIIIESPNGKQRQIIITGMEG